jgi:hypothetical protein
MKNRRYVPLGLGASNAYVLVHSDRCRHRDQRSSGCRRRGMLQRDHLHPCVCVILPDREEDALVNSSTVTGIQRKYSEDHLIVTLDFARVNTSVLELSRSREK